MPWFKARPKGMSYEIDMRTQYTSFDSCNNAKISANDINPFTGEKSVISVFIPMSFAEEKVCKTEFMSEQDKKAEEKNEKAEALADTLLTLLGNVNKCLEHKLYAQTEKESKNAD